MRWLPSALGAWHLGALVLVVVTARTVQGMARARSGQAVLTDQRPVMVSTRRNELIHRLLAGRCEICEDTVNLEVHHVRKLADLNKPGRRGKPAWMHLMAKRRRKTPVTCRRCHEDIHAGRATRPYPK